MVIDLVLTWIFAEPNTQFFESLPEASLIIGRTLQSSMIARPAFAIIVSEEALSLASRMASPVEHPIRRLARDKSHSQFRRPLEDVDEDSLNSIQAAATNFQTCVQDVVYELMIDSSKIQAMAAQLAVYLRDYVRAILSVMVMPLFEDLATATTAHRNSEQYHQKWPGDFHELYIKLSDGEKITTTMYWAMVKKLKWREFNRTDTLFEGHTANQRETNAKFTEHYNLRQIHIDELLISLKKLNFEIAALQPTFQTRKENPAEINPQNKPFTIPPKPSRRPYQEDPEFARSRQYINDQDLNDLFWNAIHNVTLPQAKSKEQEPTPWSIDFKTYLQNKDEESGKPSTVNTLIAADISHVNKTVSTKPHILGNNEEWALPLRALHASPSRDDFDFRVDHDQSGSVVGPTESAVPLINTSCFFAEQMEASTHKKRKTIGTSEAALGVVEEQNQLHDPYKREEFPLRTLFSAPARHLSPDGGENLAIESDEENRGAPKPAYFQFSLKQLFTQVRIHANSVAVKMRTDTEIDFSIKLTDTILCLNHNEFKYLPLCAGGDDDGTGGVFDPSVPPASMGPTGPGPVYHTGFSVISASSQADYEMDWHGSSVDTSIAVENGYSDHIDRRAVHSDDGFRTSTAGSVAFSYDSEDYDEVKDKGKGKSVEKNE
ncbi:hypothetical protein BJ878DRAFT_545777 [Calycina marina]|uniref:Uncharacterized protein n=1 Tax=Calycina marina TaxID=1763456 RepID=A0A9P7YWZ0_9HELO|nr:hypothetical protein BJ878DRAFT_545777 [Calycina marina]